jgi:hypothetical protein
MIPILPESSCKNTVATTLSASAHRSVKSNLIPAKVQTVTVPGPINAAVIRGPGPMEAINFFRFTLRNFLKVGNWVEFL